MKKFGKLSTSASAPVPSGLFSAALFTDQMNRRSFDENLNPLAERVERNTFASLGKNTEDGSLKRRKVTKKKVSDLERSMRHGHSEDLEFLMTQTQQGATYNLDNQGFYKLGLLLPKEWKMERRDRCRAWLVHKLGFEEKLFGSDSAYIHNSIRVSPTNCIMPLPCRISNIDCICSWNSRMNLMERPGRRSTGRQKVLQLLPCNPPLPRVR